MHSLRKLPKFTFPWLHTLSHQGFYMPIKFYKLVKFRVPVPSATWVRDDLSHLPVNIPILSVGSNRPHFLLQDGYGISHRLLDFIVVVLKCFLGLEGNFNLCSDSFPSLHFWDSMSVWVHTSRPSKSSEQVTNFHCCRTERSDAR